MRTNKFFVLLFSILFLFAGNAGAVTLKKNGFRIALKSDVDAPVKLAAQTMAKDVNKVMGFTPEIGNPKGSGVEVYIVQDNKKGSASLLATKKPLDDFESHRVYADPAHNRIYLYGKDMRGTIYAIYTFSEKILGVPPLWYWCSWQPEKHETINVPNDFDAFFKSPKVRYRAWFPNDRDLFLTWARNNNSRNEIWLETMLRLKLNTVEVDGGVRFDGTIGLNSDCMRLQKFGLVMTSHHVSPLAGGFSHWNEYWKNVAKVNNVPELTVANEAGKQNIYKFWQHCIDCVKKANIDYIWLLGFRGSGDRAFWNTGKDGLKVGGDPGNDKGRADIINSMVNKQYDMVKQSTGEKNPFVRVTFYSEVSDLMAKGYLKPPTGSNILWTYVAARRDHYPSKDLQNHNNKNVSVGLYMNFQFTSTGSHLAPAEGPWKMEYDYRYAMTKAPLQFSVVNMGNFREYMMEASANAALLWDWDGYNTDDFLTKYCAMYFGKDHAREIAQLYHDYYYSYWNQHKSDFQNMPRQYVFQDLRYSKAFSSVAGNFGNGKQNFLSDGDFNIDNHQNELDKLISGMGKAAKSFTDVLNRADQLTEELEPRYRTFYNDNLLEYARFMAGISQSLFHFSYASKNTNDRNGHGGAAIGMFTQGQRALYAAQHGEFSSWINGANGPKFNMKGRYGDITGKVNMDNCKFNAGSKNGNTYSYTEAPGNAVYDILISYTANSDKWIDNVKVGNNSYGRVFCPRGFNTNSVGNSNCYLIVTAKFNSGDNNITITGKNLPTINGIHIMASGVNYDNSTKFDAINPSANLDLSWNILDGSSTEPDQPVVTKTYYLYNVGQKKYIKTGGQAKTPDTPTLVAGNEATAQTVYENADGTITIADPEFAPQGWGIQGRNTIYESNNGSTSTRSWGTTLIPTWKVVSTGDADGSVYLEYTWGTWTKGNLAIEDPSNKTFVLTYGNYDQSTDVWSAAQKNDVAEPLVFGGSINNLSSYGANAKWLLLTSDAFTGIRTLHNAQYAEGDKAVYTLSGQRVATDASQLRSLPRGIYIIGGKKIIIK